MTSSRLFQVVRPIKDLPPREIRVFSVTANPTEVDLIRDKKEMAFDVSVINTSGSSINLFLNGETTGIPIANGDVVALSDVQIGKFEVTGGTSGITVITNVLPIPLLERLNREAEAPAVETA